MPQLEPSIEADLTEKDDCSVGEFVEARPLRH